MFQLWYSLAFLEVIELRHEEISWNHPNWAVRIWVPVTTVQIINDLHDYLKIILPAGWLNHYRLLEKSPNNGFGFTDFNKVSE